MKKGIPTRIPVKSGNAPTGSGPSSVSGSSRAIFPSTSSNVDVDCEIQKFCKEGTPSCILSKSNSHTNLSSLSIDEDLKEESNENPGDSDSSDDEKLLQNVIKTAWEQNRNTSKVQFYKHYVAHTK